MVYPRELQALRKILAGIYYDADNARNVAGDAGLDITNIDVSGSPNNFWHNILIAAHNTGKMPMLFANVLNDNAGRADLAQAIEAYRQAVQKGELQSLPTHLVPTWYPVAGAALLLLTIGFLMYLVVSDRSHDDARFISLICSLTMAGCGYFWGTEASARGSLSIPFVSKDPIAFGVTSSVASFIIVLVVTQNVIGDAPALISTSTPTPEPTITLMPTASYKPASGPLRILEDIDLRISRFNVAVADFCLESQVDLTSPPSLQNSAEQFPQEIANSLGGLSMTVIGPDQLLFDCEAVFDDSGIAAIREAAERLSLDMVVFGRIMPESIDQYWVEPFFVVVDEPIVQRASEATTSQILGEPIVFRPDSTGEYDDVVAELQGRAAMLNELMAGLSNFSRGNYATATGILCTEALELETRGGREVREMVKLFYLFCAHASLQATSTRQSASLAGEDSTDAAPEVGELYEQSIAAYNKVLEYEQDHPRASSGLAALYLLIYANAPLDTRTFCAPNRPNSNLLDEAENIVRELRTAGDQKSIPLYTQIAMEKAWGDINFYRGFCAPTNDERIIYWTNAHKAYDEAFVRVTEEITSANLSEPLQVEIHMMHGQLSFYVYAFEYGMDPPLTIPANFYLQSGQGLQDASDRFEKGGKLLLQIMRREDSAMERLGLDSMITLLIIFCQANERELASQYLNDFTNMLDKPAVVKKAILDRMDKDYKEFRETCGL